MQAIYAAADAHPTAAILAGDDLCKDGTVALKQIFQVLPLIFPWDALDHDLHHATRYPAMHMQALASNSKGFDPSAVDISGDAVCALTKLGAAANSCSRKIRYKDLCGTSSRTADPPASQKASQSLPLRSSARGQHPQAEAALIAWEGAPGHCPLSRSPC